jgi:hypothetical protein
MRENVYSETKYCIGCEKDKPTKDFYENKRGYLNARCKKCENKGRVKRGFNR